MNTWVPWFILAFNVITYLAGLAWAVHRVQDGLDRRLAVFEATLRIHADTLVAHAGKMEKQDDILLRVVSDIQRLIGRLEARQGA